MPKISIDNVLEEFSYTFTRTEKESFGEVASNYCNQIKAAKSEGETEEHCKVFLIQLLSHFYPAPNYSINTSGRADLVIKQDNKPLVLFETKNTNNSDEMPTENDLNKKGLWELFLYYLEKTRNMINGRCERVMDAGLRTLVVTNFSNFIIFDAQTFDKLVSPDVINFYTDYKNGHLQSQTSQLFYDFCRQKFLEIDITNKIKFVSFNFLEMSKKKKGLTSLAKLLKSYLIKDKAYSTYKPNVLNSRFYEELLYIMGLKETNAGSKNVIQLDNSIVSSLGQQIYKIMVEQKDANQQEATKKAISLSILWINRLLFIKLFEGQLIAFNGDSIDYKILDRSKVTSFDDLFKLFFNVLGKLPEDRCGDPFYNKFTNIPYLNSSLFEKQEIETTFVNICELKNDQIRLCPKTRIHVSKKNQKEPIVNYIIDFLNSYSFNASLLDDDTLVESRDIIDSSVLGLIFENPNAIMMKYIAAQSFV